MAKHVNKIDRDFILSSSSFCAICKNEFDNNRLKEVDHVLPYSIFRNKERHNLILLCNKCNSKKNNLYGKNLLAKIYRSYTNLQRHLNKNSGNKYRAWQEYDFWLSVYMIQKGKYNG